MDERYRAAQRFVGYGFKVFPLVPLTKIPFEGSNGFKDATDNTTLIKK